ncbi:MAG: FecR domain-containing protein [Alphaproteobacteria bacterium]
MRRLPILLAVALAGAPAAAQVDIGVSAIVVNQVRATMADRDRVLRVGDRVFQNERIETAAGARTQIIFRDETTITVGPNSSVVLDTFVYDPARGNHRVVIDTARGVLRFVTGSGSRDAYEVRTPVATVGVRGTILDILVGRGGETTVLVVEGAADIRSLGSGRLEAINRAGLASTVASAGTAPTTPAPPSAEVRRQLQVLSPAVDRQSAGIIDGLPVLPETKNGVIIDSTLPAEVIRDRLQSGDGLGGAPGRPPDGILSPPRNPGQGAGGGAIVTPNPGPIRPTR